MGVPSRVGLQTSVARILDLRGLAQVVVSAGSAGAPIRERAHERYLTELRPTPSQHAR